MEKHLAGYRGKNCIVTGGAGFLGAGLVQALLNSGAHVVVIDNFIYGSSEKNVPSKARLIKGDVRHASVFARLPKRKYHYFFHFAGPSSTVLFSKNLTESCDITIGGFLNGLSFSADHNIRYVYPSSGSVYSGINPPHKESRQLNYDFLNTYAKNKVEIERIAMLYRPKIHALGLRILAGYGPGEFHKDYFTSVVYSFCRDMFAGHRPIVWGDGKQRRDFVFVDDIVDVILTLAVNCDEPVVNVGTGRDVSFLETIDIINKLLGKKIKPVSKPRPKLYLQKTIADIELLRKYYRKPFTALDEGIRKTLDYIKFMEKNKK